MTEGKLGETPGFEELDQAIINTATDVKIDPFMRQEINELIIAQSAALHSDIDDFKKIVNFRLLYLMKLYDEHHKKLKDLDFQDNYISLKHENNKLN